MTGIGWYTKRAKNPTCSDKYTRTLTDSLNHWLSLSLCLSLSLSRSLAFMAFGSYWGSPIQLSYLVKYWSSCASARSFAASVQSVLSFVFFFCACCFQWKKHAGLPKEAQSCSCSPLDFAIPCFWHLKVWCPTSRYYSWKQANWEGTQYFENMQRRTRRYEKYSSGL